MGIDKFLAWINVRILMMDEEIAKLDDGRRKHELYVKIHELKEVRNSYNRINGGANA